MLMLRLIYLVLSIIYLRCLVISGASSPGQMHRMKSHPGSYSPQKFSKSKRKSSGAENRSKFESHKSMSDSFGPGQATFCPMHLGSDSGFQYKLLSVSCFK